MRINFLSLGVLLLIGVVAPIVVFQVFLGGELPGFASITRDAPISTDRPTVTQEEPPDNGLDGSADPSGTDSSGTDSSETGPSGADAGTEDPGNSEPTGSPRVISTTVDPEPGTPISVQQARARGHDYYFAGAYMDLMTPLGGQEMTLLLPGPRTRTIYTRPDDGVFVVTLSKDDFPAELMTPNREPLVRFPAAPAERVLRLNLHLQKPRFGKILSPSVVTAIQGEESCRILIHGSTALDRREENVLVMRVRSSSKVLSEGLTDVTGGDILGDVELYGGVPFAGKYRVDLIWRPFDATKNQRDQVEHMLPEPVTPEVTWRGRVYLGRKSDEELQEKEIETFYSGAYRECWSIRQLIHMCAAGLRGQSAISKKSLEALKKHKLYAVAVRIASSGSGSKKARLERWRKFIDQQIPEILNEYRQDRIPYPDKYPKIARSVTHLSNTVRKFAALESNLLYRKEGIRPESRDFVEREFDVATEWVLVRDRLSGFLKDLRKDITGRRSMRRFGR